MRQIKINMKTLLTLTMLATVGFGTMNGADAQNVNIPDANFKNALLNHTPKIDTNNDGEIQVTEASAYKGMIYVGFLSINDLTGIEAFTGIDTLICYNNQLTSLDVSKNTALTELYCTFNLLTSLDVSKNAALTRLECVKNQLTSLDVSKNTALTFLGCYYNQLTSLDVSKNTALITLYCYDNQLTSLDVSKNTALTVLYC